MQIILGIRTETKSKFSRQTQSRRIRNIPFNYIICFLCESCDVGELLSKRIEWNGCRHRGTKADCKHNLFERRQQAHCDEWTVLAADDTAQSKWTKVEDKKHRNETEKSIIKTKIWSVSSDSAQSELRQSLSDHYWSTLVCTQISKCLSLNIWLTLMERDLYPAQDKFCARVRRECECDADEYVWFDVEICDSKWSRISPKDSCLKRGLRADTKHVLG